MPLLLSRQTRLTALERAMGTVDIDLCTAKSGDPTPPFSRSDGPELLIDDKRALDLIAGPNVAWKREDKAEV